MCHKQTDESLKETLRITDNEYGSGVIIRFDICRKCYNDIIHYFGPDGCYH